MTAAEVLPAADRCVIYARISRDDSGEGVGVARQRRLARELADRNGWHVVAEYEDNDTSGYSVPLLKRDGWAEVERLIATGEVAHVVAYNTDRITRDAEAGAGLLRRLRAADVDVVTVAAGTWETSQRGTAGSRPGCDISRSRSGTAETDWRESGRSSKRPGDVRQVARRTPTVRVQSPNAARTGPGRAVSHHRSGRGRHHPRDGRPISRR